MRAAGRFSAAVRRGRIERGGQLTVIIILAVCFVAGAAAGAFTGAGAFYSAEDIDINGMSAYDGSDFWRLLFSASKYHLLILAAAASLLGALLIPVIFLVRGFVLCCAAAALCAAYPGSGRLLTLVILGIPALFAIPGLFILGYEGFRFSARLALLYQRKPPQPDYHDATADILLALALIFAAAAAEYIAVPALVRLLI